MLGDAAEAVVAARLVALGWILLGRRVRAGRGELDLVLIDPGPPPALAVVEVRWRASRAFGLPEETVGRSKRAHLRTAVARLLDAGRLPDGTRLPHLPIRVDLVAVEPARTPGEAPTIRHHRAVLGR